MNKGQNNNQKAAFIGSTVNVFGEKLWEVTDDVAIAMKAANTDAKPLAEGSDAIRAVKAPGLYYQSSQYGLQLVCVFSAGKDAKWGYAGIVRDSEGDLRIDEEHTYDVHNVVAKRSFTLKGETTPLFNAGFATTKAYPAS
jgi:hypothetical protein